MKDWKDEKKKVTVLNIELVFEIDQIKLQPKKAETHLKFNQQLIKSCRNKEKKKRT